MAEKEKCKAYKLADQYGKWKICDECEMSVRIVDQAGHPWFPPHTTEEDFDKECQRQNSDS